MDKNKCLINTLRFVIDSIMYEVHVCLICREGFNICFEKNVLCYLTVHRHNYDKRCTILSHIYRNSLMVVNYECICGFIYKSVEKHRLTLALFIKSMQKASRIVHLKWPVC